MRQHLILFSILFLLLSLPVQAQSNKDILKWGHKGSTNFIFTPQHKEVLINTEQITIRGENIYQRTTGTDINGTKFNPQRWVVIIGADSLPGLSATFYDLDENTTYTFYHSLLQLNIDSSLTYKKSSNATFTTPVGFGNYGTYSSEGHRLYFSNGNRIILK